MRTYEYGNYPEWKIEALKMSGDFYRDVLRYDPDIDDDIRKELEVNIKKINEWLGELSKEKKDVNKSPEVLAWKIKTLEEIKKNIEINIREHNESAESDECGCGRDENSEDIREMYEEELKYVKRWLTELKV